jgi:hypothetical protein
MAQWQDAGTLRQHQLHAQQQHRKQQQQHTAAADKDSSPSWLVFMPFMPVGMLLLRFSSAPIVTVFPNMATDITSAS